LRLGAAALFAALLLVCSPAMAVDAYDFGEVELGSQSSVGLDIQNLSPSSEMTFDLELASGGGSGFSLPAGVVTIPAGGVAQAEVVFSPNGVGAFTDTLNVKYMTFIIQQVSLSGAGIKQTATQEQEEPDTTSRTACLEKWISHIADMQVNGRRLGDQVEECIESADDHGEAVRCVAYLAADLRRQRIISHHDARDMRLFAAKSRYHHNLRRAMVQEKHQSKWGSRWSERYSR
jgi:hypothetical protein